MSSCRSEVDSRRMLNAAAAAYQKIQSQYSSVEAEDHKKAPGQDTHKSTPDSNRYFRESKSKMFYLFSRFYMNGISSLHQSNLILRTHL
jgi:hypothetical protein